MNLADGKNTSVKGDSFQPHCSRREHLNRRRGQREVKAVYVLDRMAKGCNFGSHNEKCMK